MFLPGRSARSASPCGTARAARSWCKRCGPFL